MASELIWSEVVHKVDAAPDRYPPYGEVYRTIAVAVALAESGDPESAQRLLVDLAARLAPRWGADPVNALSYWLRHFNIAGRIREAELVAEAAYATAVRLYGPTHAIAVLFEETLKRNRIAASSEHRPRETSP